MILPILLGALLLSAPPVSMDCAAGPGIDAAQTDAVRGPNGATAVLKVSTADDHSKNSHECEADYQLLLTPAGGGASQVVDLTTVDADYGRRILVRLDGFSQDGKHILGIFSETGKYPLTMLFDYDPSGGQARLVDLRKQFTSTLGPKCSGSLVVVGTAGNSAIVLELESPEKCSPDRDWVVNSATQKVQPLPRSASIVKLYKSESMAGATSGAGKKE